MTDERKQWIDGASYEDLLRLWRFATVGNPMFMNDTGDYFSEVMLRKSEALSCRERVSISKKVGWDPPPGCI